MWTERSWKQEDLLISTIYILVNASKQVTMKILKYKEAHNLQTTQIIIKGSRLIKVHIQQTQIAKY